MPTYRVLVRADIPKTKYFDVVADDEEAAEAIAYDLALDDDRDDWGDAYDHDTITVIDVEEKDEEEGTDE